MGRFPSTALRLPWRKFTCPRRQRWWSPGLQGLTGFAILSDPSPLSISDAYLSASPPRALPFKGQGWEVRRAEAGKSWVPLSLGMQKRQRQTHFGPAFWVGPALSRRLDKMTSTAPFQPRLFTTLCAVWFIWKAWAIFHVASIYSYCIFSTFKRNFRAFLPLSSSALD